MSHYEALFADLRLAGVSVRGLRQTNNSKWEAQLHLEHKGRMIERIAIGPTAYLALVNCLSIVEWAKDNPPVPKPFTKGSLDDLLGIVSETPAYSALTEADIKSLKL